MKNTNKETDVIYLSMGCFWNSEYLFYNFSGVISTEVGYGYANPNTNSPNCGDAFRTNINHREVVKVIFKNEEDVFVNIIKRFLEHHTIDNSADNVPHIYQSAIYYEDEAVVIKIKKLLEEYQKIRVKNNKTKEITTQILKLEKYLKAEEHHQKYFLNNKELICMPRFNGVKYV